MRRYRGSAVVAAAKKEREGALENTLLKEINTFYVLAKQVQLPWIDLHWIRHHIFEDPPISVSDLPILTSLNGLLAQQLELSSKICLLCDAREELLGELLSIGEGCLPGNLLEDHLNHDHMKGRSRLGEEIRGKEHHTQEKEEEEEEKNSFCSASSHITICEKIEEIDIYTDAIIALIGQWRRNLTFPLPFIYKGENYLSRLYREYSSSPSSVSPSSTTVTKPSKQKFRGTKKESTNARMEEDEEEGREKDAAVWSSVPLSPSASLALLLSHIRNAMIASRSSLVGVGKEAAETTIAKGSTSEGREVKKEINGREVADVKTKVVATTAASSLPPPPPASLLYISPYDLAVSSNGVGVGGSNTVKKAPHRRQQVLNQLLSQHRTTNSKHPQQHHSHHIGRVTIESEAARQLLVIEEMLDLAKRGHCAPVLKMSRWLTPGRVVEGVNGKISVRRAEAILATRTSRLIPITNRKWKERLLMCFAGARHDLLATINATAATSIATEFVQGSERALTGRYYHKWAEWIYRKRERRREAAELAEFSDICHLSMRFDGWLYLREISRRRRAGLDKIRSEALRSLAGRCLGRWFLALKISALRLTVAQSVTKRYFRVWLFRALSCRVWPKQQNIHVINTKCDESQQINREAVEEKSINLTGPSSRFAEEDSPTSPNPADHELLASAEEQQQQHQQSPAQSQLSIPRLTTSEMLSFIRCDLKYLAMVANMGKRVVRGDLPSVGLGLERSQ